jgi:hypothetical protein
MTNIDAVAAAFEELELRTHDPKWSSWLLERLIETAAGKPQKNMSDVFKGFDLALGRNSVNLTETVANLVKDTVVTCFTKHRAAYDRAEWDWANEELAKGVSASRAYLFLYALPPDKGTPTAIVAVLRGLEGSLYFDEALANLSDDLERPEVMRELKRWRADAMRPQTAAKLRPVLSS